MSDISNPHSLFFTASLTDERKKLDMCTNRAYNQGVEFSWDKKKAGRNRIKHGVDFADAVTVFDDPQALTLDEKEHDEERYITLGIDAIGRILVVVYTYFDDGNIVRVISARKATKKEKDWHENKL